MLPAAIHMIFPLALFFLTFKAFTHVANSRYHNDNYEPSQHCDPEPCDKAMALVVVVILLICSLFLSESFLRRVVNIEGGGRLVRDKRTDSEMRSHKNIGLQSAAHDSQDTGMTRDELSLCRCRCHTAPASDSERVQVSRACVNGEPVKDSINNNFTYPGVYAAAVEPEKPDSTALQPVLEEEIVNVPPVTSHLNVSEAISVDPPAPVLETSTQFQSSLDTYVSLSGLERFYATGTNAAGGPNSMYLHSVAQNAAALRSDPTTFLGSPGNIHRLTRLALYHPILYLDDSSSMIGKPFDIQRHLVSRITNVALKIVPPEYGLDVYFINGKSFHNCNNGIQLDNALSRISPSGGTPIGSNLRKKILQPLVYDVINRGDQLSRPLLVTIITDGCPYGEVENTLKEEIVGCRRFIQTAGYNATAIRFSISLIGTDINACRFLDVLRLDDEIRDVIRVTTDRLDEKYVELRQNEKELEGWLLRVLTNPIMENGRF